MFGEDNLHKKEAFAYDYYDYGKAVKGSGENAEVITIWQKALELPDEPGNHIWKKKVEEAILGISDTNS
ncbi:MAG: hypothetical protein F6K14_27920 [Symploca sp. SIO2C1]|nr:hypothetical protein [Symploca sp. SIO2C1]